MFHAYWYGIIPVRAELKLNWLESCNFLVFGIVGIPFGSSIGSVFNQVLILKFYRLTEIRVSVKIRDLNSKIVPCVNATFVWLHA